MSLTNLNREAIVLMNERVRPVGNIAIYRLKSPTIQYQIGSKTGIMHLGSVDRRKWEYLEDSSNYPLYLLKWFNIHDNQYQAGQQVINNYLNGTTDYVILVAQMQSGKTGTGKYVVHYLKHCHHNLPFDPNKVYFICGMNDNDLKTQAIQEFKGLIPKENILFSKQLQKKTLPYEASLIIVDESHYAGAVNSLVDKFLKLCTNKPLMLSISATPMAEIASSYKSNKAIVYLNPGRNYYGIKDIFRLNRIYQSVNLTTNLTGFVDLVSEEYDEQRDNPKYNLVRLPSQWYYKDIEEELAELDLDLFYINHHSQFSSVVDFNQYLEKRPKKMTLIWIYNSLRAGKQLNTENIGFVHDTSNSKSDTISQ